MTPNYRIIRRNGGLAIHRVYYTPSGEPQAEGGPLVAMAWPFGMEELREIVDGLVGAFDRAVLEYALTPVGEAPSIPFVADEDVVEIADEEAAGGVAA